jgi:hypothetical protein
MKYVHHLRLQQETSASEKNPQPEIHHSSLTGDQANAPASIGNAFW